MKARCALLIGVLLASPSILLATELNQQTLNAWDKYIEETNSRMQQRLAGTTTFLWIDEAPGRRERVHQGEILVEPGNIIAPEKVPQGLIHDWIGAAFIPNTTIEKVFAVLADYDRYNQFFNPAVIHAKLLDDLGATRKFSLVLSEKGPFVNATIAGEYTSQTSRFSDRQWYTVSYSTRIQQIDNYGQAGEQELPPDTGTGYVWRLYSIERFEERDGGVYTELEAIALTRNIPLAILWLVKPMVQHLPRNSMVATLQKTRDAVCPKKGSNAPEIANRKRSPGNSGGGGPLARARRGLGMQPPAAASLGSQAPN
jgi:hypothetical protein